MRNFCRLLLEALKIWEDEYEGLEDKDEFGYGRLLATVRLDGHEFRLFCDESDYFVSMDGGDQSIHFEDGARLPDEKLLSIATDAVRVMRERNVNPNWVHSIENVIEWTVDEYQNGMRRSTFASHLTTAIADGLIAIVMHPMAVTESADEYEGLESEDEFGARALLTLKVAGYDLTLMDDQDHQYVTVYNRPIESVYFEWRDLANMAHELIEMTDGSQADYFARVCRVIINDYELRSINRDTLCRTLYGLITSAMESLATKDRPMLESADEYEGLEDDDEFGGLQLIFAGNLKGYELEIFTNDARTHSILKIDGVDSDQMPLGDFRSIAADIVGQQELVHRLNDHLSYFKDRPTSEVVKCVCDMMIRSACQRADRSESR